MFSYGKQLVMVILFVVVAVLMGRPVAAQTYWMWPGNDNGISLEILKPKFNFGEGFGTLNTVWFLSGRFEASEKLSIFVDLPISNYKWSGNGFFGNISESETLIGSPYIGIESRRGGTDAGNTIIGRMGIRPPLASDDKSSASIIGLATTYDRLEAFASDLWTFTGGFGYARILEGGGNYTFNLDGILMMPTQDGADKELFLNYNFSLWVPLEKFSLGAGFNGRWIVTESGLDFSEATAHQFGFVGKYNLGGISPALHLRFPLDDDISQMVNYVYGLSFSYSFEK